MRLIVASSVLTETGTPMLNERAASVRKFPYPYRAALAIASDIDDKWLPVEDFLQKPVDFDILRNRVAEILCNHASNRFNS